MTEEKEPECITIDDQVESATAMAISHGKMSKNMNGQKFKGMLAELDKQKMSKEKDSEKIPRHTDMWIAMSEIFGISIKGPFKEADFNETWKAILDIKNYVDCERESKIDVGKKPAYDIVDIEDDVNLDIYDSDGKEIDPYENILVLHITTSFGKRYTCRTVEQLETYIDNVKAEKKRKATKAIKIRDEDVDIQIGFGRMTKAAYDNIPACKYFIKT